MNSSDEIIRAALTSGTELRNSLKDAIKNKLHMSAEEFSREADISPSTMYKTLSGEQEPNLKTLRKIIHTIQRLEGTTPGREFIAIIAARPVLDKIEERTTELHGKKILLREYPATSMEEAIISAVRAERDGAMALVCAPIVSSTIEKIVRVPVATIMPVESLADAVELAAKKSFV